jgi:hypothetical protein
MRATKATSKGNASQERWIRLPAKGPCPSTGLTRPYFYQLINAGRIRSVSLKRPGTTRGVRLVWLPSVLALLEKEANKQAAS